uniref:Gon-4 like n=1 Tax=Nothobranchius furzeri TaxID=105023 RepID=A0A8C6VRV5_NOTFU
MNPVRKRLKLSPSKPHQILGSTSTTQNVWPPHDASLLPAASAGVEVEVEEEEGHLLVEEDTTDSSLIITMVRRKALKKKKQTLDEEEVSEKSRTSETEEEEETRVDVEIDRQLDQSLETKSKQHNLTAVNVKNIIHEVITNEHVVAMMKAAINETEAVPPFEPKMTRSKLKEVVEKGVVIPTWNISPIKKCNDAPQFVDIPLDDEDSSDEEYRPDEEEEDETAEDGRIRFQLLATETKIKNKFRTSKKKNPLLEHDSMYCCVCFIQPMSESEEESGVMACRTRSKRPLRNVPLGQLEAKLQAPDITPDMYDSSSAPEDKDWTDWLRGLMTSDVDNEEEGDDEDDPEYNFLADTDEPDLEDYRDDKAVRITSQYFVNIKRSFYHWIYKIEAKIPQACTALYFCCFQHVQLLIQIHLLTSPVPKLHGEAETTRQFLVTHTAGIRSISCVFLFVLSVRCFPVMPAELAWLFATRPVFLHPELLPSASLDPAMYCPRRTAAFTSAEDCLLVLGLRNMEGACDSPKLVSQFLLRKTVVQVRRRILQCCRPGTPDNIVKVLQTLPCRHVDPVTRRPPVEREEDILPLWLVVHKLSSQLLPTKFTSSPLAAPPSVQSCWHENCLHSLHGNHGANQTSLSNACWIEEEQEGGCCKETLPKRRGKEEE